MPASLFSSSLSPTPLWQCSVTRIVPNFCNMINATQGSSRSNYHMTEHPHILRILLTLDLKAIFENVYLTECSIWHINISYSSNELKLKCFRARFCYRIKSWNVKYWLYFRYLEKYKHFKIDGILFDFENALCIFLQILEWEMQDVSWSESGLESETVRKVKTFQTLMLMITAVESQRNTF